MLGAIWRWARDGGGRAVGRRVSAGRAASPVTVAAPRTGNPTAGPPDRRTADRAAPLALQPETRDEDLVLLLKAELALRCGSLADGAGDAADALALLEDLQGDLGAVIRQPPVAAHKALEASRRPDAELGALVRVFEESPALAQALLRRANSAYYATGGATCVSLHAAGMRIGMDGISGVLVEVMVEGLLCRPGPPYDAMVAAVWEHMVRTAPIARRIAPAFHVPGESAFTIALLHDVGKLVIFDRLTHLRRARKRPLAFPEGFVGALLRELHEPLGGLTILAWRLGGSAARAVATHHRGSFRYEGEPYAEVLFAAERLEHATRGGAAPDLDALWEAGGLTGAREAVRALL